MKDRIEQNNNNSDKKINFSGNLPIESAYSKIFDSQGKPDLSKKSPLFRRTYITVRSNRNEIAAYNLINDLAGMEKEVRDIEGEIPSSPSTIGGILGRFSSESKKTDIRNAINKNVILSPQKKLNKLIRNIEEVEKVKKDISSNHEVIGKSVLNFAGGDSAILTNQGLLIFEGGVDEEEVVRNDLSADSFISNEDISNRDVQVQIVPSKLRKATRFIKRRARKFGIEDIDPIGTIKITKRSTGEEWVLAGVNKPRTKVKRILESARVLSSEEDTWNQLSDLHTNHPELFEDL